MSDIFIAAAKRTAIGKFFGAFSNTGAADLGIATAKDILGNLSDINLIEEVIFGNVLGANCGMNVARQIAIGSGLDEKIPAFSVNKVCGSGLKAITLAAQSIHCGDANIILAGGTENMTQVPYLLPKARSGYSLGDGAILDGILRDGLTDIFSGQHMGLTAERLADEFKISRIDQDNFALNSQQKWAKADAEGMFESEIVPVSVRIKKQQVIVNRDEHPRPDTTPEKIATIPPAFKPNGSVTAANASGINDGAAAVLIANETGLKQACLTPIVKVAAYATAGVDPALMGLGPVKAVEKLLKKTALSIEDIDIFELNEAFASQSIACIKELKLDPKKVNTHGGAIAIGHPIGASGARIVVTLIHAMKLHNKKRGIAALCIGGGMGIAIMLELC